MIQKSVPIEVKIAKQNPIAYSPKLSLLNKLLIHSTSLPSFTAVTLPGLNSNPISNNTKMNTTKYT